MVQNNWQLLCSWKKGDCTLLEIPLPVLPPLTKAFCTFTDPNTQPPFPRQLPEAVVHEP